MVHISIHPTSSNSISNSISNIVNANYSVHSHLAMRHLPMAPWGLGRRASLSFSDQKGNATLFDRDAGTGWTHDVACRPLI